MTDIDNAIRMLRTMIFITFAMQAAHCVVGAFVTGVGMYAILQHAPITGGLFIILAFVLCRDFIGIASDRVAMRAQLRALHQYRREHKA